MPKCWIRVQLIPNILGLLRYHKEKNCNWKPATNGSVGVETTNTVQYICIDVPLRVSMCSVTIFLIVCGDTKGQPHSCAGTTLLYIEVGSQCWYIVDLLFTEATAYWYAITHVNAYAYVLVHISFILHEVGCAMPQPLAAGYLPQWPGSEAMPVCGKSMVDKVVWDTF
jgi:hypothetical protein